MKRIRFDDVDVINTAVSEDFGDSEPKIQISQRMINAFADLTGDRQCIHVDSDRATAGPFGTTVAHGFLTLNLLPKLIGSNLPVTGFENVVNYGVDRLRFIGPIRSDSVRFGPIRSDSVQRFIPVFGS